MLLRVLALVAAVLASLPASAFDDPRVDPRAPEADPAPPLAGLVRPLPRPSDARCTADGRACVALATYVADVCRLIEAAARENAIDENFFARLLWKESLFDASAVSPAGAEGIAQFMPGTAKMRGLADAFNPAEALYASAAYLADLSHAYGNIGLAAAAYNAGEAGLERFLAAKSGLPAETRAYVAAITGYPVEAWRDAPPETLDLALAKDGDGRASRPTASPRPASAASGSCAAGRSSSPGGSSSPRTARTPAPSARSAACRTATPRCSAARRSPIRAAAAPGCAAAWSSPRSAATPAARPTPSAPACGRRAATAWC